MDLIQLHHIPRLGVPVPIKHSAYIQWRSDGGIQVLVCFLGNVGDVGAPLQTFREKDAEVRVCGTCFRMVLQRQ